MLMRVWDSYRISKSIKLLLSSQNVSHLERMQAMAKLKGLRIRAVPRLIEALGRSESPGLIDEILAALLDNSTLPAFCDGLSHPNARVVDEVVKVLSRPPAKYDPNRLLERFDDPNIPKAHLVEILSHYKETLDPQAVLRLLDTADRDNPAPVLRLVDEVATRSLVADLIRRLKSDDRFIRLGIVRILSRFSTAAVRDALTGALKDSNKAVRSAALDGLVRLKMPIDTAPIAGLLRDPDLTVQSKAIEAIIEIDDPKAVQHLLDLLQDESEYVRRAVVEVLNKVGNTSTIKDLLGALRDKDWWVRVRAADALGTIGGPRVVEAVLGLLKDEDEFIRRGAIEVLNVTKDERAFGYLLQALEDPDWWVRERAVDALAELGDKRAVPALIRLMQHNVEAAPVVIRALTKLGDPNAIPALLTELKGSRDTAKAEALQALIQLTDERHAGDVQAAVKEMLRASQENLREQAGAAFSTLIAKYGEKTHMIEVSVPPPMANTSPSRSILPPESDLNRVNSLPSVQKQLDSVDRPRQEYVIGPAIDAATLQAGTVLADRYRVVRRIGSGAFGIVILVDDTVVREQVILKFLKPHIAGDEKLVKRFIQELRYARRITHENVIRIHDFLKFGTSCAISMEYFPSHSLASEIKKRVSMDQQRALKIIREICHGMSVAHQVNIIHRDLKPANVLIGEHDQVKIVDFGLAAAARSMDSRLTTAGMVMGTPAYMAPEQVRSTDLDKRIDIYSLGVVMYELVTGRLPYIGSDPLAILYQHLEGKPTPPSQLNARISPALEGIVLKAMAVKPEQRYQSMEELREQVDTLLIKETA